MASLDNISLLLEQLLCSGSEASNAEHYTRILGTIGSAEVRMDRLTRIFECFDPVWPKYTEWTASLFQMIAQTLLPEKNQNEVMGEYVNSLMVQSYNSVPPRYVEMDPNVLSWELLVLIYMNMIGFQFPVKYSYDPRMDDQKTWIRELLLRVVKHHSQETKK